MNKTNIAQIDALVLAAQAGKVEALQALYQIFQPAMLRFAFKMCNDRQLAFDVVHDAWMSAAKSISSLRDPRTFRAWLFRATKWKLIDAKRKASKFEVLDDTEQLVEETPEQSDDFAELITALNFDDQQLLHLFYHEDFSLQEIAVVQEIPVGTVKSRLNRARNRLKQHLEN